jgi:hypothetical protein
MTEHDVDDFNALMDDAADMLGRDKLGERQLGLHFAALADHSLPMVRAALLAHMRDPQRGRFMPTPADVIAQIAVLREQDGRPGVEEAWAVCVRSQDEAETVVWTQEMAQAWGVARAVLPDEVGARMAFKEAYQRLMAEARRIGDRPVWTASLGSDLQRRRAVVAEALAAKRLPISELPLALPAPQRGVPMLAFVGELAARADAPASCRARLLAIRERLASGAAKPSAAEAERQRTAALKAQAAQLVAQHGGGAA